jgi:hypothetical protein
VYSQRLVANLITINRNSDWSRARTTLLGWTAKRPQMKSAADVSQQIVWGRTDSKLKRGSLKSAIQSGFVDWPEWHWVKED